MLPFLRPGEQDNASQQARSRKAEGPVLNVNSMLLNAQSLLLRLYLLPKNADRGVYIRDVGQNSWPNFKLVVGFFIVV